MQLSEIKENFVAELRNAAQGKSSSLPFLIHTVPRSSFVGDREVFQVLVVGGTYYRSALCTHENGKVSIQSLEVDKLPIFSNRSVFLDFVNKRLQPHVRVLALSFAYPMKPIMSNNTFDGYLVSGSKEHAFTDLIGDQIGKTIEDSFAHQGRQISVTVANDTICLLLSGLQEVHSYQLAGGVVGTGLNFALFLNQHQAVNLESSNFSRFDISDEAKIIDDHSNNPGRALFEKEVSGKYLYQHYNLIIQKKGVDAHPISSTEDLAKISQTDSTHAWIARELFNRSAKLVACQIAGIMEFLNSDLTFVMEGSLFWEYPHYQDRVRESLTTLTKYKADFRRVDESSVIGAAMLVKR